MKPDKLVLFDGVCNLCNGFVKFIIKRDREGKIMFAPLQSAISGEYLTVFNENPYKFDSVIYISENQLYTKSSAILHILKDLGRGWQLMFGFIILPTFFRDMLYNVVARTRYRIFGKKDSCMIPSPDIQKRFLS